jgi:hypothetical protein
MLCKVCKINPVKIPHATTCGLECACELNWDSYAMVRARLTNAVAWAKLACVRGNRNKA